MVLYAIFIFINILYNMALKNRRTQNKKSNKKRQQSKRGGKRTGVKRTRRTRKRGGGEPLKQYLFKEIHSQSINMKTLLKNYMDNEDLVVTDDQIGIIQTIIQKKGFKTIEELDQIIGDVIYYDLEE